MGNADNLGKVDSDRSDANVLICKEHKPSKVDIASS